MDNSGQTLKRKPKLVPTPSKKKSKTSVRTGFSDHLSLFQSKQSPPCKTQPSIDSFFKVIPSKKRQEVSTQNKENESNDRMELTPRKELSKQDQKATETKAPDTIICHSPVKSNAPDAIICHSPVEPKAPDAIICHSPVESKAPKTDAPASANKLISPPPNAKLTQSKKKSTPRIPASAPELREKLEQACDDMQHAEKIKFYQNELAKALRTSAYERQDACLGLVSKDDTKDFLVLQDTLPPKPTDDSSFSWDQMCLCARLVQGRYASWCMRHDNIVRRISK